MNKANVIHITENLEKKNSILIAFNCDNFDVSIHIAPGTEILGLFHIQGNDE